MPLSCYTKGAAEFLFSGICKIYIKDGNRVKKKIPLVNMILVGLFAAIFAVVSQLSIPLPTGVPVTLQSFIIPLCGFVLGWKLGTCSMVVYILIGVLGAPVFANFQGGLGALFGKTGGFLIGYVFFAMLCGLSLHTKNKLLRVLIIGGGLAVNHLFGIVQFSILTQVTFFQSAVMVSFPYIVKDAVFVTGAYFAASTVRKALRSANIPIGQFGAFL